MLPGHSRIIRGQVGSLTEKSMKETESATMENVSLDAGPGKSGATSDQAFCCSPRRVRPQPVISVNGHRLKAYEIYFSENEHSILTGKQIVELVRQCLPTSSDPLDHCIGFLMVHFGRDGDYLLVSHWYGGNMLKHDLFEIRSHEDGWRLIPLRSTGIVACVWELQVINFERQAWVSTAMAQGGTESSFVQYLNTTLDGWI